MRPLTLTIEGLRSFRVPVKISFGAGITSRSSVIPEPANPRS